MNHIAFPCHSSSRNDEADHCCCSSGCHCLWASPIQQSRCVSGRQKHEQQCQWVTRLLFLHRIIDLQCAVEVLASEWTSTVSKRQCVALTRVRRLRTVVRAAARQLQLPSACLPLLALDSLPPQAALLSAFAAFRNQTVNHPFDCTTLSRINVRFHRRLQKNCVCLPAFFPSASLIFCRLLWLVSIHLPSAILQREESDHCLMKMKWNGCTTFSNSLPLFLPPSFSSHYLYPSLLSRISKINHFPSRNLYPLSL